MKSAQKLQEQDLEAVEDAIKKLKGPQFARLRAEWQRTRFAVLGNYVQIGDLESMFGISRQNKHVRFIHELFDCGGVRAYRAGNGPYRWARDQVDALRQQLMDGTAPDEARARFQEFLTDYGAWRLKRSRTPTPKQYFEELAVEAVLKG